MAKGRKPRPVVVEPFRARAVRGPHKDGSGRWYWHAYVCRGEGGGQRTVWTGWAQRANVCDTLRDIEGLGPVAKPAREPVQTVRDLLECWVAAQLQRNDLSDSWRRNARNSGKHLCELLGDAQLSTLGLAALERYRDTRIRQGWASATVKQHLKKLRAAWSWGGQMGVCPNRALPNAPVKVKPTRDKYTPSQEELRRVFAELDGWPRLLAVLLLATGARIGEVSRLRWGDVDLDRGLVTFNGKTGKRMVPLAADALSALKEHGPSVPEAGLFGVTWKGARARFGSKYLKNACQRAQVRHFTPNAFRRAAVNEFARAKVDVGTSSAFLGHSPETMFKYYRQVSLADQRRALLTTGLGSLGGTVIPFPKAIGDET